MPNLFHIVVLLFLYHVTFHLGPNVVGGGGVGATLLGEEAFWFSRIYSGAHIHEITTYTTVEWSWMQGVDLFDRLPTVFHFNVPIIVLIDHTQLRIGHHHKRMRHCYWH